MLVFEHLTSAQKDALLQLGRNAKGLDSLVTLIGKELEQDSASYEKAKEALVTTGNNREVCLSLKARVATLSEIGNLLESLRKI